MKALKINELYAKGKINPDDLCDSTIAHIGLAIRADVIKGAFRISIPDAVALPTKSDKEFVIPRKVGSSIVLRPFIYDEEKEVVVGFLVKAPANMNKYLNQWIVAIKTIN